MSIRYHHGNLKSELLHAVEELVEANGVRSVTARSVADVAGVSHTALNHHYGSMAGLLTAFVTEGFVALTRTLQAAHDHASEVDALERFRRIGMAYLGFAEEHSAHFQVMFQASYFDSEDERYLVASVDAYEVLAQSATELVEAGIASTENFESLAILAWAAVHGLAVLWHQGSLDTHVVSFPALSDAGEATLPLLGALISSPSS